MDSAKTVEQYAYCRIRARILSGALRPGVALPEIPLSRELGASRTPVRHAIRQLEREGLVVHTPGLGAVVKEYDAPAIQEVAELRTALETAAAGHAAERITRVQLLELRAVCEEILAIAHEARDAGTAGMAPPLLARHADADERFHYLVLHAAGNRRISQTADNAKLIHRFITMGRDVPAEGGLVKYLARHYREHARIFRAIRAGDAGLAARRMEDHLRFGMRVTLGLVRSGAITNGSDERGPQDEGRITAAALG